MFDIGFLELLVIGVIALLVMGPERLPEAIRTGALWMGRLRRSFQQIKSEIEREVGADEIRQQIHNESIMKDLKKTQQDLENQMQDLTRELQPELDKIQDSTSPNSSSAEPHTPAKQIVPDSNKADNSQ